MSETGARGHAQRQFLEVVDPEVARARWHAALRLAPLGSEDVPLAALRGRVLAEAVAAPHDVPGFDRSNVDGYAVVARDTYGASETRPARLRLRPEIITTGPPPPLELAPGEAVTIATGGVVPRGADAVLMLEDTDVLAPPGEALRLAVRRPAIPGAMISLAGSDITRGEVVLRPGVTLGPRETGVLAALGLGGARVYRRPRVAILSTGDELVAPGAPRAIGQVHDCNQTVIADACAELGCEPLRLGIARDDDDALAAALRGALDERGCDVLLLSGGTSKGAGDRSHRALAGLPGARDELPATLVHGVALKPGKPLCLGATRRPDGRVIPIAVLPGFPTSALFCFHELVAPVLRALLGLGGARAGDEPGALATLPRALASERGRRQFVLVQLLAGRQPAADGPQDGDATSAHVPVAHPIDRGSGSISAFCRADGFVTVDSLQERLEAGELVRVRPLALGRADARGPGFAAPDLTIIGSHCVGLELLADLLDADGLRVRLIAEGSQGGLFAAARELCDIAPIHLHDPETDTYNAPFVPEGCVLAPGYGRMQGLLTRPGDPRFAGRRGPRARPFALPEIVLDPGVIMVNRNRGSGTRLLIDRLLAPLRARREAAGDGASPRPRGYHHEARSHQGVATCVAQGRADWGVAIATVARDAGLEFAPIGEERYDFVIPRARAERAPVRRFLELLASAGARARLRERGFLP
ncbi:MAG: molybdopterin biosynthesis protein [Myxococcales bacterium]|nr:molybdopterin biosynthesis protein [Myxococcales bacterium]